jgi:phosphoribosylformylglycinamidine synthase
MKRMTNVVRACVLTGYGINADRELETAFRLAGAEARRIYLADLIQAPDLLNGFDILAFPGGFSFGDHMGSGKVLADMFRRSFRSALEEYVARGNLIIGICNGFQVLVKMGILPNLTGNWTNEVSLIHNDSGKFEDRWVRVVFEPASRCVWTKGLTEMELPVRHGEGKLVTASEKALEEIVNGGLVAMSYAKRNGGESSENSEIGYPDNPNGSVRNIAGITDRSGRIFGLMPHPEAFVFPQHHPRWPRENVREGLGLRILRRGVTFARDAKGAGL